MFNFFEMYAEKFYKILEIDYIKVTLLHLIIKTIYT